MQEEDNTDEEAKIYAKKLQRKAMFTAGYICMFIIFMYFLFSSALGNFYFERKFSNVVNQLNQLSRDAEKASGS